MTRTRSVIVVIPLTRTFEAFSLHRLYKGLSFLLVFLLLGEIELGLSRGLTPDNESFLVDSLGSREASAILILDLILLLR